VRVAGASVVPGGVLLDAPPALVEGLAGEPDDVERVHHGDGPGELFAGGGFEAGEPVHRDDLDGVAPGLRACGEPGLERLLGTAFDHVQQPGRAGAVPDPGQIDAHCDVLVALTGVPPYAAIDTKHPDTVEPGGVGDQDPAALGQDRVVGGIPRDPGPSPRSSV